MNTTTKHEVIAEKAEQVRQSFWDLTNIHEGLGSDDDFHIQMAIVDLQNATRELYRAYHKLTTASLRIKETEEV
jgi:hypothetical protein